MSTQRFFGTERHQKGNHPHYLKKTTTAQRRKLTLLFSHQSALAIAASQFNERYFRKQNKKSTFFSKSVKMSKIEKKVLNEHFSQKIEA